MAQVYELKTPLTDTADIEISLFPDPEYDYVEWDEAKRLKLIDRLALDVVKGVKSLQYLCHQLSVTWHIDPVTGERIHLNHGERLMLVVSEIAEAMEGDRKNLMDDKLPHRKMVEVELADAIIRIGDFGGMEDLDIAGAIIEKLIYNVKRYDHKPEARLQKDGKKY